MTLDNLLIAYPYLTPGAQRAIAAADGIRVLVDSGAFTAFKSGKAIQLDSYCRFIEKLPFKPWRYFTLDVIGNPDLTVKNYETMLARGFNPIPVFTRGESASVLEDYYKTSDVVGVGGLVKAKKSKEFIRAVMQTVKDRKVHWLGFTKSSFIKTYKPYSVDCSSWIVGQKYGVLPLYFGGGKMRTVTRDLLKSDDPRLRQVLARYNVSDYALRLEKNWRGKDNLARAIGAQSYILYSRDLEKNLGTKLFCATTDAYVEYLLKVMRGLPCHQP